VRNAVSHSGAAKVVVSVDVEGGRVVGAVEDDGRGFDPGTVEGGTSGGLALMSERASMLGGTFSVDSSPGGGTRVAVGIPVPGVWR
jgi:signal transduction histidine kinase